MEDRTGEIGNLPPSQPLAKFIGAGNSGDPDWAANALDELERLRAWKAEAMAVLSEWDKAFEAAGRPGPLGGSMAIATRVAIEGQAAEITDLRLVVATLLLIIADEWGAPSDDDHFPIPDQTWNVMRILGLIGGNEARRNDDTPTTPGDRDA